MLSAELDGCEENQSPSLASNIRCPQPEAQLNFQYVEHLHVRTVLSEGCMVHLPYRGSNKTEYVAAFLMVHFGPAGAWDSQKQILHPYKCCLLSTRKAVESMRGRPTKLSETLNRNRASNITEGAWNVGRGLMSEGLKGPLLYEF